MTWNYRAITAAFLIFIGANISFGGFDIGNVDSSKTINFPLLTLDTLGRDVGNADSLHVIVWHTGDAAHTPHLTRRTISDDSTWQDSIVVAGDTTPYFFDKIADLIRIADVDTDTMYTGLYTGIVESYFQGKGVGTPFSFEITRAGVTDVNLVAYEGLTGVDAEIQSEAADAITADAEIDQIKGDVDGLNGMTPPTAAQVWTATGGDSVLNALDYTNNTHGVVRQVVSTVATVTTLTNNTPTSGTITTVSGNVNGSVGSVTGAVGSVTGKVSADLRSIALSSDSATTMANLNEILDADTNSAGNIERVAKVLNVGDSALIDGLSLAGLTGAISATTMGANSIGSSEIASGAIDVLAMGTGSITSGAFGTDAINFDAIADGAIDAGSITQDAADKIGFYTLNMSHDTTTHFHDSAFGGQWHNWAATGAGGGGGCTLCGTGSPYDTIKVADTTGTYTLIPGAYVEVYDNATGLTLQGAGFTGANGRIVLRLAASTAYRVNVVKNGYTFPQHVWTSGAGANYADSANGADVPISAATTNGYKRVWGYEYINQDTTAGPASGILVSATLSYRTDPGSVIPQDTLNDNNLGKQVVVQTRTNSNGYWQLDVPINTNIVPANSFWQFRSAGRWSVGYRFTTTTVERLSSLTGF